jgi:hypothetical protein
MVSSRNLRRARSVFKVANVSGLTRQFSSYLINTSGSGKTRILFEGLWKHWGLYFTCAKEQVLGSQDMSHVLENLSSELNFMENLPTASDPGQALAHSRNTAQRRFRQILTARLLVLLMFLDEASTMCPEGAH